jgi:pimeloyl-ACP methyl ester carboxylesterase
MIDHTVDAAAFLERDATVVVSGVEVACRFTLPNGAPCGTVLLLPGSLYSDVDGDYPSMNMRPHVYADVAQRLGERGFAVLRMAKIGPGTGSRTCDTNLANRHVDFLTRVDVAAAGLDVLRSAVIARPVIVAGHSEGAVVASLLASGPAAGLIDGVVSLSGPASPILSILRGQVIAMAPPGATPDMTIFDRTIEAIRAGGGPPAEAKTDPQTAMLAAMPDQAITFLRGYDKIDPVAALAKVRKPVLIVQGGRDDSVPLAHAALLQAGRDHLPTDVLIFPPLTHFYKVAPADLTPMQSMALNTKSDPAVADAIAQWAKRLG